MGGTASWSSGRGFGMGKLMLLWGLGMNLWSLLELSVSGKTDHLGREAVSADISHWVVAGQ